MPGHAGFLAILDEVKAMHQKKAADYGTGADPFANIRASERFGIPSWVGAVLRANDKITRIQSFLANGKLENESLEDSLLDAAAYFLIALALRREKPGLPLTQIATGGYVVKKPQFPSPRENYPADVGI